MAAKKKKPKPFRAATAVKAAARNVVGAPPPTRAEPGSPKRKRLQEKHKQKLEDLLEPESD
jgi:hypothetical protein